MTRDATTLPPTRPGALPLPQLRAYRDRLRDEADRVAYWRRVVQTRIDASTATVTDGGGNRVDIARLATALGDTATGARREAFTRIDSDLDLPHLPDWDHDWVAALSDPNPASEAIAALADAEALLSAYRTAVHARLDEATAALIAAYRATPYAALALLPPLPPDTSPAAPPLPNASPLRPAPLRLLATVPPPPRRIRSNSS